MSVDQYVGRTVDVSVFVNAAASGRAEFDMFANGGSVVTGPLKLSQRWQMTFFSDVGSVPGKPDDGTIFMSELRRGRVRNTAALESLFYFCADQAADTLLADEDDATPDDEAYGSADLESVSLSSGKAALRVRLRTRAGSSRVVIVPLPLTPFPATVV